MAKKVVIDAGHGGEDPGTSANGIVEKDYTLKISQYMADRLNQLGIENALTRDSDVTLNSNDRPKRVQSLFGKGNDVIVVSNHINAGGSVRKIVMTKKYMVYDFISSLNYICSINCITVFTSVRLYNIDI